MEKVKFKQWECDVLKGKYGNGNIALQLVDDEGVVATATVNIRKLEHGMAHIKDYAENAGMLVSLAQAGIVTRVIGYEMAGYCTVPLCQLNMDIIDKLETL